MFKTQGSSPVILLTYIPKNPYNVFSGTNTLSTFGYSGNKGQWGNCLDQCLDKVERFALGPSSKLAAFLATHLSEQHKTFVSARNCIRDRKSNHNSLTKWGVIFVRLRSMEVNSPGLVQWLPIISSVSGS